MVVIIILLSYKVRNMLLSSWIMIRIVRNVMYPRNVPSSMVLMIFIVVLC